MFKFALKSINSKKTISILYVIALSISMTISMLSINISSQIQEGFFRVDQKYDVVVGNKGSSTQLLMSSIFFSEDPLGTLPYSVVDDTKDIDETMKVVPIALGDNYRGSKIVGTEPNLLEGYEFSKGEVFGEDFEVVVGSNVAKAYNLEIGSQIVSSHGAGDAISGHDHSDSPYKVVGILKTTNTSYDNAVFTDICNIWSAHSNHDDEAYNEEEHSDEEHHDHEEEHSHEGEHHDHEDDHEHSDEEEHTHAHNHSDGEVTAILVRSGNLGNANKIIKDFNVEDKDLQAINVTQTLRKLMGNVDISKQIALILSSLVVILAIIIVVIMTYMMQKTYDKDLEILHILGASQGKTIGYLGYQNSILIILALLISLLGREIVLNLANKVSSSLGIVLAMNKVYSLEYIVLLAIIVFSILPLIFYILKNKRNKGE